MVFTTFVHHISITNRIYIVHIAIAGNIGSGKSTLTGMLSRHYGWEARYEAVDYNPYLEDYYKDIPRWSFCLEIYFLKQRFKDVLDIQRATHTIVQDRSIFEGVYIFTANNAAQGNLDRRDYETYMSLFDSMLELVRYPDLTVYLRSSVPHLVGHIQQRGRSYEQTMPIEYLRGLNERYEDYFSHQFKGRLLAIDVDNLDFQHNPRDFAVVADKIDAELFGLFSPTHMTP